MALGSMKLEGSYIPFCGDWNSILRGCPEGSRPGVEEGYEEGGNGDGEGSPMVRLIHLEINLLVNACIST